MSITPPVGGRDTAQPLDNEAPTTTLPKVTAPVRKSAERISPVTDSVSAVKARLSGAARRPAADRATDVADKPSSGPVSDSKPRGSSARVAGPLRAQVQLRWIDPWTVLKVTAAVMVVLFLAWMIGVAILYALLEAIGVMGKINSGLGDFSNTPGQSQDIITPGMVFGFSALIGVVNSVLTTALTTVAAFVFNLCADLIGGVEVTLADPE
jgi:hypothetical protein